MCLIEVLPFRTFPFPTASISQPCLKHLQIYGGEWLLHTREVNELSKMLLYTAFQMVRPQASQSWQREVTLTWILVFPDGLQSKTLKKAVQTKPNPNRLDNSQKRAHWFSQRTTLGFFFSSFSGCLVEGLLWEQHQNVSLEMFSHSLKWTVECIYSTVLEPKSARIKLKGETFGKRHGNIFS